MPTDRDHPAQEPVEAPPGTVATSPEDAATGADPAEAPGRIPLDLVGGMFLLGVVAVFLLNAGDVLLDWIFPLTLSYTLGIIGVYLTIRGLLSLGDKTATLLPILRGKGVDVFVFSVLTAVYVGLARLLGFWLMSLIMLFVGAVYLDHERTPRRVLMAAVVALVVCVVAYVILRRVFFVPLPNARWLPF